MTLQNNPAGHNSRISKQDRERLNGHPGAVVWFTGLSASGKSTLAYALEEKLHALACHVFVLDGDNMRQGLSSNLGFSAEDRSENLRRAAEVARLFAQSGTIVLAAFISPSSKDRAYVRNLMQGGNFFQIYCDCALEICEQRDPKGLYKKARQGLIREFTGVSSVYERPGEVDLVLHTGEGSIEECVDHLLDLLRGTDIIPADLKVSLQDKRQKA